MKEKCDPCAGTGQVSFFKGESRFLLSTEECPYCLGFGYKLETLEKKSDEDDPNCDACSGSATDEL